MGNRPAIVKGDTYYDIVDAKGKSSAAAKIIAAVRELRLRVAAPAGHAIAHISRR
jgi:hypothetical protein